MLDKVEEDRVPLLHTANNDKTRDEVGLSIDDDEEEKTFNGYGSFVEDERDQPSLKGKEENEGLVVALCPWLSSLYSLLTFGWLNEMFVIGNSVNQLSPSDLKSIDLPENARTENVSAKFNSCWEDELLRYPNNPSLGRALARAFGKEFLNAGFYKLVHDLLIFVGPIVLNHLIEFFGNAEAPRSYGLWLTVAVTMSQLIMSLCLRQYFHRCFQTGLQLRTAVVAAVYEKSLTLAISERQIRSSGEITNLMSVDAQRLQDLTSYLHAVWYSFLQIGLAISFLWNYLGPSCLGGVAIIVIMIPVSKNVAGYQSRIQKDLMEKKDSRVDLNNEVLSCMKIIKLQAWEAPFQERIQALREVELERLLKYIVFNTGTITLWSTVPLLVGLGTFATYIIMGNSLDVAKALTALALFDILRFPLFMLPKIINNIIEAQISSKRVRDFLIAKDHKYVSPGNISKGEISIESASFVYDNRKPNEITDSSWELLLMKAQYLDVEARLKQLESGNAKVVDKSFQTSTSILSLRRIDFSSSSELIAVVGSVGSGKSTLINSILGEVRGINGSVKVNGRIAYCAQTPFIMNDTVKANVLFGNGDDPVDEERYKRAIAASALEHDLHLLPGGDKCEIGEKGVTLSGGQKARVSLARAVYDRADIILLDDPLAAVDAHVGRHLFQKCIVNELLYGGEKNSDNARKRTVILVTNALQYLSSPHVSKIIVLDEGSIKEAGTYADLMKNEKSLFFSYVQTMADTSSSAEKQSASNIISLVREMSISAMDTLLGNDNSGKKVTGTKIDENDNIIDFVEPTKLMTDEMQEREIGAVGFEVYLSWAKAAGGIWVGVVMVLFYISVEGINVLSKWWLAYWSEHGNDASSQVRFLLIYALINITGVICIFFRILFILVAGLRASRKIFDDLLISILKAPQSFFDTTPLGRIVNRFSKDIYVVDEKLPDTLRSYLATTTTVLGTIVVICSVTPVFIISLFPTFMFYLSQQRYFSKTYREIKRIDSVARSPIYALFSETLDGVATIRAFFASQFLLKRMKRLLNEQQLAYYLTFSSQCWLAVRLELAGTFIVSCACLAAVLEHKERGGDDTFAGFAGLSISFALSVTQSLNWTVRMAADLEAAMIAVERINQYNRIKSEAPRHTHKDFEKSSLMWPRDGAISFEQVKMKYRHNLPFVLKGLDIRIPAGSKVGVVGRTGAGKSTLSIALLRICELDSGAIFIDGVNIKDLGLQKLRSAISIIPQDPVLFSGSVRTNLDPFNSYEDSRLLDVLDRVGLFNQGGDSTSVVTSLSDPVFEGGTNFSVGQKQLLVIARALLQEGKIVVMDEATAAVDAETDQKLQLIMKKEFHNSTCITIAHRLNTIMDSDLILCMDDGKSAQFGRPADLLKTGGLFKDLVDAWEEDETN